MRLFKQTLSLLLTIAALTVGQSAWAASTWTITPSTSGNKTTFTISRSGDTSKTETVLYRFVGLSAYAGQHFKVSQINGGAIATPQQIALLSGSFTFAATETSKTVTIEEMTASNDAYIFQNGTSRSYKLEVTDQGGFLLKDCTRSFNTGTSVPSSGAFNVKDITIRSGEISVTDAGYAQGYHSMTVDNYFNNAAPKAYFQHVGAQLRMTLTFQCKEVNDGWQYVQIYANQSTSNIDAGAGDGNPGDCSFAKYVAGFEHKDSNADTEYKSYTFPVTSASNDAGATNPWGHGSGYNLHKQIFNNSRASDGRLIIPLNLTSLYVRYNASGSDRDDWVAKNTVAHIQAIDATAPTALDLSVAPGYHAKGNTVYVSVAFKEIVTSSNAKLNTNWGTLSYNTGSGSNVLTFKGTIGNSVTGSLNITGYSGTITDLAGNNFTGTITGSNLCALDANYNYPITYELNGGSVATANPATYTYDTATFTLNNPTRTGYTFDGWTGSNGTTASTAVKIEVHSHGDKSYTANWIAHTYTVRFHSNYDTDVTSDQAFTYDTAQNLTADVFSRTGYTFAEWTTNADGSGTTYTNGQELLNLTTEDGAVIDLYAQWTANTYTVHFDANNGSGTMTDQPFTYDAAQNLTTNTFSAATGYVFNGWNTQANGTGTSYTDGQSVSNLTPDDGATFTLYANWTDVWGMAGGADGTQQHPYIITTTAGFDLLAKYVNGTDGYTANNFNNKYFKLGADITVSTMVGTNQTRSFQGTFDGDNKTITLALTATSEDCAPFKYLYNATIKNLNIAGTISTSNKFAASIAAHTYGTTNIEHCTSTVEITSTVSTANSDGTHGGFVGVNDNGTLSFSNCVFAGKLLGANATCNGGFVGWNEKTTVNYTDCLFAPAEITMGEANSATFNRNGKNSFTRTFFLTPFGEAQGTHATTTVPANGVYKNFTAVDGNNYYAICDITVDDLYAYTGSVVTVTPIVKFDNTTLTEGTDYTVTIKDSNNNTIAPEDLIETGNYTLIVAGTGSYTGTQTFAFSISTSANLNGYDFGLGTDSEGIYYKIETTDDLNRLAAYVNNGNEAYDQRFMLTADIAYTPTTVWNDATSTENNYTAIGNSDHAFCGTFDGQGHTVSGIRIYKGGNGTASKYLGLFGRVWEGTVKNVILIDARITGYQFVGGITGQTNGSTLPIIENCLVLNAAINSDYYFGSVIGHNRRVILTSNYYHNCTVNGETSNVGADGVDINGARNVHALTLGTGISTTATVAISYNCTNYYTAGTTVNLTYSGTVPEGYMINYSYNDGTTNYDIPHNTFAMPASDVTVSTRFTVIPVLTLAVNDDRMGYMEIESNLSFGDLAKSFDCSSGRQYGVFTDGTYIYTSSWSKSIEDGHMFHKYDANGTLVESFNIEDLPAIRDITTDGTYFYGGANSSTIYIFNLSTKTKVGTIECAGLEARHISYDPVRDGFWTGNWGNLALYDRNGNKIKEGPSVNSASGSAYYKENDGDEHLLLFCQPDNNSILYDYNITSNTLSSESLLDCVNSIPNVTGSSGGSFIGMYNNQLCWFGDIQQTPNLIGILPLFGTTLSGDIVANSDGSYRVYPGTTVKVKAVSKEGYRFVGYNVKDASNNDITVNENNGICTFTMPAGNATVTGIWKPVLVLADDTDNTDAINDFSNNYSGIADVTLQGRTLWKDGYWNTLCVPFEIDDISTTPLAGAEIHSLESASLNNDGLLTLNFSDPVTKLIAGTPYIIKWSPAQAENLVNPLFENVTVNTTTNGFVSADSKVQFLGTYAPMNFTTTDQSILFMGADNTLYYPASGAYINACRAYFKLSDPNAQVKNFAFNFGTTDDDEDPTAIQSLESRVKSLESDIYYDLQGRKVKNPVKGTIYIHNGKKELLK